MDYKNVLVEQNRLQLAQNAETGLRSQVRSLESRCEALEKEKEWADSDMRECRARLVTLCCVSSRTPKDLHPNRKF
jgi:hypothetical protein